MKNDRQNQILELISSETINTQEGLLEVLCKSGYDVTQATVSRDIKELGIHKVSGEDGKYYYVSTRGIQGIGYSGKFSMIFTESVKEIDHAVNIVVVKCHTGMANAACATFDGAGIDNVVGTLSGDDTFIVIMRDEASAIETCIKLNKQLNR